MGIWIAVFVCTLLPLTVADKSTCSKDNCKVWDTRMVKCVECDEGFQGECCQRPCRYPNYGDRCQSWCNCEITSCSSVTGCDDGSPTVSAGFPNAPKIPLSAFAIYTTSTAGSPRLTTIVLNTTSTHIMSSINRTTKECSLGYTGNNCEIRCRYPSYGVSCQLECNCTEGNCHFQTGCIDTKTAQDEEKPLCKYTQSGRTMRRESLEYGVAVLGSLAVIQFSAYFYLRCLYRPVFYEINHL
ncbi:multiple epidermal growth factor-like domains protein 10 [Ostrea edulis]|uniref:multiple epidermal growth factor-like domains protein 10 n=1 Tax=Ostrea edulis TaxID=37623 RepID=UPI0024AED8C7|nr:multiple epidermal growth factor-like domains protein 10 [Ostrea edulis]